MNFDSYQTAGDSREWEEWGVTQHITTRFLHGMGHYSPSCVAIAPFLNLRGIERSLKYLIFQELQMSKYYQMTRLKFVFLMMINKIKIIGIH